MTKRVTRLTCALAALFLASCEDAVTPVGPGLPSLGLRQNATVHPGNNLKAIIDTATGIVTLDSGDFYTDLTILIQNKTNFTIRGASQTKTRIHPASSVPITFQVGNNVTGLTISDLTIQGATPPLTGNTHGIGMSGTATSVSGLYFVRLQLLGLGVGISVAGTSCDDVTIFQNTLVGIISRLNNGATSGSGYGIHNQGCTRVRIAENYIEDAERHSIYQALGPGPVTIEHNFILNNLRNGLQRDNNMVALVVARSQNVSVAFNTVANPYFDAMSIEHDPALGGNITNVQLIGNKVIGARTKDLFINAAGTFQVWGNEYYHRGSIGPTRTPTIRTGGQTFTLDTPTVRWHDTQMLDARTPGDSMFVLQNNVFHRVVKAYGVNPDSWNYTSWSGPWSGTIQAIAADDNAVYAMISNSLRAFYPAYPWWTSTLPSGNWLGFEAMTMSGGELYVVKSAYLYHVNKADFSSNSPAPRSGWQSTQALAGFNGKLFLMQGDCMHQIDTSTLWYSRYWC